VCSWVDLFLLQCLLLFVTLHKFGCVLIDGELVLLQSSL